MRLITFLIISSFTLPSIAQHRNYPDRDSNRNQPLVKDYPLEVRNDNREVLEIKLDRGQYKSFELIWESGDFYLNQVWVNSQNSAGLLISKVNIWDYKKSHIISIDASAEAVDRVFLDVNNYKKYSTSKFTLRATAERLEFDRDRDRDRDERDPRRPSKGDDQTGPGGKDEFTEDYSVYSRDSRTFNKYIQVQANTIKLNAKQGKVRVKHLVVNAKIRDNHGRITEQSFGLNELLRGRKAHRDLELEAFQPNNELVLYLKPRMWVESLYIEFENQFYTDARLTIQVLKQKECQDGQFVSGEQWPGELSVSKELACSEGQRGTAIWYYKRKTEFLCDDGVIKDLFPQYNEKDLIYVNADTSNCITIPKQACTFENGVRLDHRPRESRPVTLLESKPRNINCPYGGDRKARYEVTRYYFCDDGRAVEDASKRPNEQIKDYLGGCNCENGQKYGSNWLEDSDAGYRETIQCRDFDEPNFVEVKLYEARLAKSCSSEGKILTAKDPIKGAFKKTELACPTPLSCNGTPHRAAMPDSITSSTEQLSCQNDTGLIKKTKSIVQPMTCYHGSPRAQGKPRDPSYQEIPGESCKIVACPNAMVDFRGKVSPREEKQFVRGTFPVNRTLIGNSVTVKCPIAGRENGNYTLTCVGDEKSANWVLSGGKPHDICKAPSQQR